MFRTPLALLRWLPATAWMSFIFAGSSDTLSGARTSRFVGPFLKWVLGASFTPERAEAIHYLIRKAGHLSEYGLLCGLLWFALGGLNSFAGGNKFAKRFWLAVSLSALYAASDEFHQSFVPSRTANVGDVLIDVAGATLGLAALLALCRWRGHPRRATTVRPGSSVLPARSPDKF